MKILFILGTSLFINLVYSQECKPSCCDVLVMGDDNSIVGINCSEGGIDCGFSGQITACCESINSLTNTKIGNNCKRA